MNDPYNSFHGAEGFQTHQRAKKVVSNKPRASRFFYGATIKSL